jgi:cytochrome oxidase assembly protein ShyY1
VRRLIPHLAALAVILACIALTRWQLDRAEQKTQLLERETTRSELNLASLAAPFDLPQPINGSVTASCCSTIESASTAPACSC